MSLFGHSENRPLMPESHQNESESLPPSEPGFDQELFQQNLELLYATRLATGVFLTHEVTTRLSAQRLPGESHTDFSQRSFQPRDLIACALEMNYKGKLAILFIARDGSLALLTPPNDFYAGVQSQRYGSRSMGEMEFGKSEIKVDSGPIARQICLVESTKFIDSRTHPEEMASLVEQAIEECKIRQQKQLDAERQVAAKAQNALNNLFN